MPQMTVRTSCDLWVCHAGAQRLKDYLHQCMEELSMEFAKVIVIGILLVCCVIIAGIMSCRPDGSQYALTFGY